MTDEIRDSNRFPARHLAIKLRYLNANIIQLNSRDVKSEIFNIVHVTNDQKLILAQMEHNRWIAEKMIGDYHPTLILADTDLQKKLKDLLYLHKDIRPWAELSIRDKDKDHIILEVIDSILSQKEKKNIKI